MPSKTIMINFEQARQLLQIQDGMDYPTAKRQYLRQVKQFKPERFPEEFRQLREAWELLETLYAANVNFQTIDQSENPTQPSDPEPPFSDQSQSSTEAMAPPSSPTDEEFMYLYKASLLRYDAKLYQQLVSQLQESTEYNTIIFSAYVNQVVLACGQLAMSDFVPFRSFFHQLSERYRNQINSDPYIQKKLMIIYQFTDFPILPEYSMLAKYTAKILVYFPSLREDYHDKVQLSLIAGQLASWIEERPQLHLVIKSTLLEHGKKFGGLYSSKISAKSSKFTTKIKAIAAGICFTALFLTLKLYSPQISNIANNWWNTLFNPQIATGIFYQADATNTPTMIFDVNGKKHYIKQGEFCSLSLKSGIISIQIFNDSVKFEAIDILTKSGSKHYYKIVAGTKPRLTEIDTATAIAEIANFSKVE